jgi:hypothetical protein
MPLFWRPIKKIIQNHFFKGVLVKTLDTYNACTDTDGGYYEKTHCHNYTVDTVNRQASADEADVVGRLSLWQILFETRSNS